MRLYYSERLRADITVRGVVQGVGFRPFVYRCAAEKRLKGFVRNLGDATVNIAIDGEEETIQQFVKDLQDKKPLLASIHDIAIRYNGGGETLFEGFRILDSVKSGVTSGSVIPADAAICDECLSEMKDTSSRRFSYFFNTCTDCGPRYTTILETPYDRVNTTMKQFQMCKRCENEYVDPLNRRFHAQTIACPDCGPKIRLTTAKGEPVECKNPIQDAGRLLNEGCIVAVKGNGGFHLAAATTFSEPVIRLRQAKHRSQKPFAVMAQNLQAVNTFAQVSEVEAELLTSYRRPIVLLRKSAGYCLAEEIAPGLNSIGVMLPYSGLHVLLLNSVGGEPALIMTSGNHSGEPIVKDETEALKHLGCYVDYFLVHDREIAQRCDDSVVKMMMNGKPSLIRRSRGYAPEPLHINLVGRDKNCVLGLGGDLNVTVCSLLGERAYLSQHIGDIEVAEMFGFLKETVEHLVRLTKSPVQMVAHDLHPGFLTTRLAAQFELEREWRAVPVQHHYAHAASIMGEHGLSEMVGIACDGVGYGLDGHVWGGEVLECSRGGFKRQGHLQEHPMVGGDLTSKFPLRMVAGILSGMSEAEEWLRSRAKLFPHGEEEVELVMAQLKEGRYVETSSCGRVLDAVSALLDVCCVRTYEGEPAMKLETLAASGQDVLSLTPRFDGAVLNTRYLLEQLFGEIHRTSKADLACSAQSYLARGLAALAVETAQKLGCKTVGFSGGVAYNGQITSTIRSAVESSGLSFVTNAEVPPGDGGLSFGQAVAAVLAG
ncbi:MAG: carbamoyltransferase HypF [Thaumarchaeota archaeon]|nr:carbamoyltransferase HypF [Nitrososphaerota archaeon]MCL5318456.1 carbamoyltransferase HypF [Nitrososphaerota archaeon]